MARDSDGTGDTENHVDADDPIVGDSDGLHVDDGDEYDYVLTRPDGASFGFDAVEVAELRTLFDGMQGDG